LPPDRRAYVTSGRVVVWTLGVAAFVALAAIPSGLHRIRGMGHRPAFAAAVATLMAIWWLTEALPIAITACVPIVLFPVFGVFGGGVWHGLVRALEPFADAYIFLFLGGMAIGAAMEETNLHRRVALGIMRAVGTDPSRLLLGMLLATAAVSMWISNTATAVMMTPIAMALIGQLEDTNERKLPNFGCAVMLSVAYGSNVGGIGTKIGTGTNSIFCGFIADHMNRDVGFVEYLAIGAPFVVIFLPIVFAVLWRVARRDQFDAKSGRELIARELSAMGPMRPAERRVAWIFGVAAALWIFGDPMRAWISPHVPRLWSGFRFQPKHYEAAVAMLAACALLATRALTRRGVARIPWHTLLLLGGSFAMAAGIESSGLSRWLALQLVAIRSLPTTVQIGVAASATVGLSAIASNTATVNVMLNVLPRSLPLMGATSIAASCDFALPAGTPPNAIVFGSGYVKLPTMIKTGVVLDVAAVVVVTLYAAGYLPLVFR